MSKGLGATTREEQLELEVETLKASLELLKNQLTSQTSPLAGTSSTLSPRWTTHASRSGRASVDGGVAGSYRTSRRVQTRQRRAYSQQDRPQHIMSRSVSSHSDFDIMSLYGGAAGSITSVASCMNGSSRAVSTQGALASVDEGMSVPEVGVHPGNYLSRNWFDEQSNIASAENYPPLDEITSNFAPSAPPSMVSGFSALELTQPLTRQNSSYGQDNEEGMVRLPSSQSFTAEDISSHQSLQSADIENQCAMSSVSNADFLAMGALFTASNHQSQPSSNDNNDLLLSPPSASEASQFMEESISRRSLVIADSTHTNSDPRIRLAPDEILGRSCAEANLKAGEGNLPVKGVGSGSHKKHTKPTQVKTPYQRPKGPKVFCVQCEEHPEGFRGEHELRRHLNAKHKGVVKKYICRDPATVGIKSGVSVLQPLSDCKACSTGKKYGAYYNAAAHLRRTHFKPKADRGKKKRPDAEKRGGKGGGDWPPMYELKHWFEEIHIGQEEVEEQILRHQPKQMHSAELGGGMARGGGSEVGFLSTFEATLQDTCDGDDVGVMDDDCNMWMFVNDGNTSDFDAEGDIDMSFQDPTGASVAPNGSLLELTETGNVPYGAMPSANRFSDGLNLRECNGTSYYPDYLNSPSPTPVSAYYADFKTDF